MNQARKPDRSERLKAALRENLKRRKSQARARRDGEPEREAASRDEQGS